METVYPNGKRGPLVIETPERKNQGTGELAGYSIPICLWQNYSSPTSDEKPFYDCLNKIAEYCQQHLENEFGPDAASHLSNPLYFKQIKYTDKKGRKKTKNGESAAPVLYANLIYSEKFKKILTLFSIKGKQNVKPFDYLDQYCKVKLALIIEIIFMSKTVTSIQIKAHEVYVKPLKP